MICGEFRVKKFDTEDQSLVSIPTPPYNRDQCLSIANIFTEIDAYILGYLACDARLT